MDGPTVHNALIVPPDALPKDANGNETIMAIGSDDVVRRVVVKTGVRDSTAVQVLSGPFRRPTGGDDWRLRARQRHQSKGCERKRDAAGH